MKFKNLIVYQKSKELGYISEDDFTKIEASIDEIDKMIVSLSYLY